MPRAIFRIAVSLLTLATRFPLSPMASAAGPLPKASIVIPFSYAGDHLIAVRGSIGAREGLTFLVDLGTTYTLIDRKIASQFQSGERLDVSHFSGSLSTNEAVLPLLTLGAVRVTDFHVYLTDLAEMPVAPAGVAGIIGADFLSRGNVTFDFASQKIVFSEHVSGEHQAPLEKCAVGYAVQAFWKNQQVKLALSNGVALLTLDRERMNEKPLKLRGLKPGTLETNFSVTPVALFKTNDIVVNDIRLHGEGVLRKIDWPVPSDQLDGFLPLTALRASRVSLDFERGLLLWDALDSKTQRARSDPRSPEGNSLGDK